MSYEYHRDMAIAYRKLIKEDGIMQMYIIVQYRFHRKNFLALRSTRKDKRNVQLALFSDR